MSPRRPFRLLCVLVLLALLQGCAAVVIGGAAVTAVVLNDRRSVGTVIDDQGLELASVRALNAEGERLAGSRIKPVAFNGTVLLLGEVADAAQRERAGEVVSGLRGVARVVNELAVGEPASVWRRTRDTTLTSRAKAALLDLDLPGFDATKVNVTAVRAEVYAMGLVSRAEADAVTDALRQLRGVRRVVKVFEYTD